MLEWGFTMKVYAMTLVLSLAATTLSVAIPKPGDGKNRVVDKELSDEKHFAGEEEHNAEYDHQAFLGRDEARTFEDLSPEESKERLGKIFDKIDKDGDKKVSEDELRMWIKYVQNKYILEDSERQWKEHEVADNLLPWESYKQRTYGTQDENDEDDEFQYKDMIRRDKRRWKKADSDDDDKLTQKEFSDFLHPEESDHMRDIVVEETLEDIDKDKDGLISLEEYIADMWPNKEDDGEEMPDWVKTEQEQFHSFRDRNKDGHMDKEEVADWIIPSDYDHSEAEAKHLIHESDSDGDGTLTKDEVVQKYDLFVGSQATDFGEALTRHDEF